ncbi:MAG: hypothetical protein GWM89_11950 [Candidatus Dadabacteria bacterium]|nr:hypothetical protein [Candidatus Dadabacteria bacterium]NIY23103.1 hypothetical protein [Candidatus Dadabacteria bacterium]
MKKYFCLLILLILTSFFIIIKPVSSIAQCTQDSDCGVKQYCAYKDKPELANYCKPAECTQNSHCTSGKCVTQISGKDYYKCVMCTSNSHCSGTLDQCKVVSNQLYNKCVECLDNRQCATNEHCIENSCQICSTNSHCSGKLGVCLRNRANPDGRCVQCTTNSQCTLNQICDTTTYKCKTKLEMPENQIDPKKYPADRYKNKSLKKLETLPEIQKKQIDLEKTSPKNVSPKDMK